MNKRGISPLIATVLLVGLVVILAAAFFIFFSGQVKLQAEKADVCSPTKAAGISFTTSCTKDGNVAKLTIKNTGKPSIPGVWVRCEGSSKSETILHDLNTLKEGKTKKSSIKCNELLEEPVTQVTIIPVLVNNEKACTVQEKSKTVLCN